jgi:hypothetical protein
MHNSLLSLQDPYIHERTNSVRLRIIKRQHFISKINLFAGVSQVIIESQIEKSKIAIPKVKINVLQKLENQKKKALV